MNIDYRRVTRLILIATLSMCAFALPVLASGPHMAVLVRKNGTRTKLGKVRYLASSKVFEVFMKNTRQQVPAAEVERVILKTQPAALRGAVANVQHGNYAAAVGPLKKIRSDYEMFGPDVIAAQYLAKAYLGMGKAPEAARACKDAMAGNPNAINSPDFAMAYWEALLKSKKYSELKRMLDDAVQTGARPVAAAALLKRGDLFVAQGDARSALREGYLRVILMSRDVKSVQPEALYKAVKAHESLGEHNYAEKWRKLLLSGYPTSSYAKKI